MFQYTNRRGVTYYLHGHTGRGGTMRYTLKKSPEGALDELPEGYEVVENVNGQASVRRERPRQITAEEKAAVEADLRRHGLERYRLEVRDDKLTIYEPDSDPAAVAGRLGSLLGLPTGLDQQVEAMVRKQLGDAAMDDFVQRRERELRNQLEQMTRYAPVLRFRLVDNQERRFLVARMSYRGEGGWHELDVMPLAEAAERYLPHLGQESFFDLV